ncbi:MAG: hypothetical protein LUE99_03705 [Bacteroides sp.]|nr:hypothetical protein [Bacteroides sp.]
MLTPITQTAIAAIGDIAHDGIPARLLHHAISSGELSCLLSKLEGGGLIRLKSSDARPGILSSYVLARAYQTISLLDILEATGEHLNCNQPTKEELCTRFHGAANRLGVINQMTRIYLSEIKMTDF